ncbi:hypothetical protein ACIGXM_35465 [Kitasatospora sp. NPDC052896]|uniref:hypothetical protein n=1 Tax=Kitasatospora sp. NPDC052896 TaxID=3364061 RepID=UPI0037C7ECA0
MVLAQVWGLGLGVQSAAAVTARPLTDTVRATDLGGALVPGGAGHAGDPAGAAMGAVNGVVGTAGPAAAGRPTGTVDQLLHSRIKAGDLPLPGQVAAVPDAFTIASVLLPTVPGQARPHGQPSGTGGASARPAHPGAGGVASHGGAAVPDGASNGEDASGTGPADQAWAEPGSGLGRPGGSVERPSAPAATDGSGTVLAARSVEVAASWDNDRLAVDAQPGVPATVPAIGLAEESTPAAAAHRPVNIGPLAATGSQDAVFIPIAAGLLLTGAAMYKHRGLPRGH